MNNDSANDQVHFVQDEKSKAMALELFHTMATRVPAYIDFLKKNNVDREVVKTYDDFIQHVPIIDKPNYVSAYPLDQLCLDGNVFNNNIISVSSGSTGVPFFWPRGPQQDIDNTAAVANIYDSFGMDTKTTLLVNCFSMGTWVAGTLVEASTINYANQGNKVSLLTPGIEKISAIDSIKRLSANYDQVVLCGYPPFVKDLIEEGARMGIDWKGMSVKLFMGGESFSEEWRDYVHELVGASDVHYDSKNLYGAADIGVVAHETPLSVLVRRAYNGDNEAIQHSFGTEILPSLHQFDSSVRHIEKVNDELVITSNSGIPLVRYNLKDTGNIMSYEQIVAPVKDKIEVSLQDSGVKPEEWPQPFVFLNGRKDFSITVYSVNVYPENIKAALIDPRIRLISSGRFTMATVSDNNMDQQFELNIELAKDVPASDEDQRLIQSIVIEKLTELNSEYRKLHETVGEKAAPNVHLISFGDQNYFARGIKHKWAKKEA